METRFKIKSDDPIEVMKSAHQAVQQAEAWRNQRQFNHAEKMCLSLLKEFPDYFAALHTLGLVYGDMGERQKAVQYLVQAVMINPRAWTTMTALAGEYLLVNAREMAIRTLRDALEINSEEPAIYVTLAQVYYDKREYLLASQMFEKALELSPNMEEAIYGYSNVCNEMGRFNEAKEALDRLSDKPPTLQLLKLQVVLPSSLVPSDLLEKLDDASVPPGSDEKQVESDKAFVRATAYDKLGKHGEAWDWIVKANNLVLKELKEDIKVEMRVTISRADWTRKNASAFKNIKNDEPDYPNSLFILGLSRSGKTTAESIICTQPGLVRGYENPAINNAIATGFQMGGLIPFESLAQLPLQLYSMVRSEYRRQIEELIGDNSWVTNTSPGHIWDAAFFSKAIPNMRFVFMKRDIDDLMFRIYTKKYRLKNTYSYDLKALKQYIESYNSLIDTLHECFPENSIILSYEDMIADPKAALKQMCELCDIKPNYKALPKEIPNDVGCAEPYKEMMHAALKGK